MSAGARLPPADAIRGARRGAAPVPLSVLDLVPVGAGQHPAAALGTAVRLAALADELGFHRYWVAEHHSSGASASSSPAVLLARLAAGTRSIRLGSGGVMLPNFAPLLIAEQFGTLEALAPGRVDLGVGRAYGADRRTAAALRRDGRSRPDDDFAEQVQELAGFLDGEFAAGHRFAGIHAVPGPFQYPAGAGRPPLWLLGSSPGSARLAGSLGLPYAFAAHIAPEDAEASLAAYRESFRASAALGRPYAAVSVSALAADTERAALGELLTGALATLLQRAGRSGPLPAPEAARAWPLTTADREALARSLSAAVYGTPATVRAGLNHLAAGTGADELIITAFSHTSAARLRSYELIAGEYGLTGPRPADIAGRARQDAWPPAAQLPISRA